MAAANVLAIYLILYKVLSDYHFNSLEDLRYSNVEIPLTAWAVFVVLMNGLVLCVPMRTKAMGAGVVLGAIGAVLLAVLWWVLALLQFALS